MNKKELYESIMSAVAKEVKKALLENENIYSSYHEVELDAIHFNELPANFKTIKDDDKYVLAENMSREELINFISNIDWPLLAKYYEDFYPNADTYYEGYLYDIDLSMNGGTIYAKVPCSSLKIKIDVDINWYYNPYSPGDYYQPPEGGYGEIDGLNVTNVEIIIDNNNHIKLSKDEIINNKLNILFYDEIYEIIDNNYDEDYFHSDDDAYDRWKDEHLEDE